MAAAHPTYSGVHRNGPSFDTAADEEAARASPGLGLADAAVGWRVLATTRDASGLWCLGRLGCALGLRNRASGSLVAVTRPAPSARATAVGLGAAVVDAAVGAGTTDGLPADGDPGTGVGSGVRLGLGFELGLGFGLGLGLGLGLGVGLGVWLGVAVGLGVAEGSDVGVGSGLGLGSWLGLGSEDALGPGSAEALGLCVDDGLGCSDGLGSALEWSPWWPEAAAVSEPTVTGPTDASAAPAQPTCAPPARRKATTTPAVRRGPRRTTAGSPDPGASWHELSFVLDRRARGLIDGPPVSRRTTVGRATCRPGCVSPRG